MGVRMQFLIVLVIASMASAASVASAQTSWLRTAGVRSDPVLVRSVIDGDTIDVLSVGRVRLLGIDAPEIAHGLATAAPFGQEAKDRLTALLLHRWIRLERDVEKLDMYNRHLAYVLTDDGQFINAVLVREGLARVSARTALTRLDELKRAEAEAQVSRRGIWGATPQIPSSSYTRPKAPKTPKVLNALKAKTRNHAP